MKTDLLNFALRFLDVALGEKRAKNILHKCICLSTQMLKLLHKCLIITAEIDYTKAFLIFLKIPGCRQTSSTLRCASLMSLSVRRGRPDCAAWQVDERFSKSWKRVLI